MYIIAVSVFENSLVGISYLISHEFAPKIYTLQYLILQSEKVVNNIDILQGQALTRVELLGGETSHCMSNSLT